jgi:hypothetical protein
MSHRSGVVILLLLIIHSCIANEWTLKSTRFSETSSFNVFLDYPSLPTVSTMWEQGGHDYAFAGLFPAGIAKYNLTSQQLMQWIQLDVDVSRILDCFASAKNGALVCLVDTAKDTIISVYSLDNLLVNSVDYVFGPKTSYKAVLFSEDEGYVALAITVSKEPRNTIDNYTGMVVLIDFQTGKIQITSTTYRYFVLFAIAHYQQNIILGMHRWNCGSCRYIVSLNQQLSILSNTSTNESPYDGLS